MTNIAIEADWHTGTDLTGLDNVVLTSGPVSTPEPTSFALLSAAIVGLQWRRRRRQA